ncbi:MAG: hypothetical protein C0402_07040 [Thermodesulfovibrio sp.]|nr:hypothetical protein [Thermodesulfovibrio sp.]
MGCYGEDRLSALLGRCPERCPGIPQRPAGQGFPLQTFSEAHMSRLRKLLLIVYLVTVASTLHAEVVLDGTMGRSGSLTGPNFMITGDLGKQAGGNLFHSFSSFNIQYDESATFAGPGSVQNIIARVTGGSMSNINGLLRSTIPGADLYFINPSGVFFGQGASLDLQGSLYVSSADYLRLGTEGRFDAADPGRSILTSAPPAAFGFLSQTPASVYIDNSQLEVYEGKSISIVGGDLLFDNAVLWSHGGRINIVSAASQGEVVMSQPDWNTGAFAKLGETLLFGGYIVTSGGQESGIFIRAGGLYARDAYIEAGSVAGPGGGKVDIKLGDALVMEGGLMRTVQEDSGQGGDLKLDVRGMLLTGGAAAGTTALGSGNGGDVIVQATEIIEISGADQAGSRSSIFSYGNSTSTGTTGRIFIATSLLDLAEGGLIITSSGRSGHRGDIRVSADRMRLFTDSRIYGANMFFDVNNLVIGSGSYVWSQAEGLDDERAITINAGESIVIAGEQQSEDPWRNKTAPLYTGIHTDVFINADGNAGDINISSPLLLITDSGQIGARTYTDGHGGDININAGRIELISGGQIGADSFGSSLYYGPSGNITVRAGEAIVVSGVNGELESGFSCNTRSSAGAGLISVTTPLLTMSDYGQIAVTTGVFGEGRAGDILVNAGRIELFSNSSINSASRGHGLEGSIRIIASESILLDDGHLVSFGDDEGKAGYIYVKTPLLEMRNASVISTLSGNDLTAGDITIDAGKVRLEGKSGISSESRGRGRAGQVSIHATDTLLSIDSSITTAAAFSTGGNIMIDAANLILTKSSRVSATVGGGSGDGGNLSIRANALVAIEDSDITARADQGFGGSIAINAKAVIFSRDSEANASSNVTGQDGTVEIQSPDVDISGFLTVLSSNYLNADLLLPKACALADDKASSFIITGREMLPPMPEGFRIGR